MLAGSEFYGAEVDAWSLGMTLLEAALKRRILPSTSVSKVLYELQLEFGAVPDQCIAPPPFIPVHRRWIAEVEHARVRKLIDWLLEPCRSRRLSCVAAADVFFVKHKHQPMPRTPVEVSRRDLWSGGVTEAMRTIVVSWLVELTIHFKVRLETAVCTVGCMDAFVARASPTSAALQKIASACFYLCLLQHERDEVKLEEIVEMSANDFTKEQLTNQVSITLATLDYNMHRTVPFGTAREVTQLYDTMRAEGGKKK